MGAGFEQKIVVKHAHELGIEVIAVDGNPSAEGLQIADKGIVADIKDISEMCRLASEYHVDGVMTHAVEIPYIVSRVAEKMKLPGLKPEIAEIATNKLFRITRFKEQNIPSPFFSYASSKEDALKRAKEIGFPLVMKPIDSAGARGVCKINNANEICRLYDDSITFSSTKTVLLEEFLNGPEISTESIIVDEKIITTGFADRNYDTKEIFKPHLIENGHTLPSILPEDKKKETIEVAEKAIRALGINFGVAKGDLIIDDGQPKILEMAARTSGGRFASDMVPLATGVDIIRPLIQMSIGITINMDFLRVKYNKAAAQRFFFPSPGKIIAIKGLEEAKNMPGVYDIFLNQDIRIGGIVREVTNHTNRIGYVIATADRRKEAIRRAESVVNKVKIEVM